jgi:hypothetical protein
MCTDLFIYKEQIGTVCQTKKRQLWPSDGARTVKKADLVGKMRRTLAVKNTQTVY